MVKAQQTQQSSALFPKMQAGAPLLGGGSVCWGSSKQLLPSVRLRPMPLARLGARCYANRREDTTLAQSGFGRKDLQEFQMAIMGDLHLAPEQMHLFHDARDHFLQAFSQLESTGSSRPGAGARVVQLGDLGHGKHKSGSRSCFEFAKSFLDSFGVPYTLVLGNHDLEGEEFETDPDNLEAWKDVWQQPHMWAADVGPVRAIGLSTVRYRSNENSHHEVYIDDAQMAWFEEQLAAAGSRPVVVFTHAPPQGCGLKVIQEVHVKNRCAWLNHSDRPERFMSLVSRHPNVRMWFSGHFHTSHNYRDSVSLVGHTAFVQVGVIGECNRDGYRHSRLLQGDSNGFKLYTVDHSAGGTLRLDLTGGWSPSSPLSVVTPAGEMITPRARPRNRGPASAPPGVNNWILSTADCGLMQPSDAGGSSKKSGGQPSMWFPIGDKTILELQGQLLVEYDLATAAPIGLVCKVPPGCEVRLLDAGNNILGRSGQAPPGGGSSGSSSSSSTGSGPQQLQGDGSNVAVVEVEDRMTGGVSRYPRNQWGGFFQIYQPNKWKLKVAKAMAEREARIAAEAAATAAGLGADQHSQAPAALAGEATVTSSAAPTTVVKEAVAVSA